jgi:predicted ABC-type ATPase
MSRLDLVVGPNGSGKSTFVRYTLATVLPGSAFVNADVIAARRWPGDAESHTYDAAKIAAATRAELIRRRCPLIAETVFSHPSKLDLIRDAHAADYTVVVHVLLIPEDLAVVRVAHRVASGGHAVPETKIRKRFHRLWPLVAEAIVQADSAIVYDNTRHNGPREIARFTGGLAVGAPVWPNWTPDPLSARWH